MSTGDPAPKRLAREGGFTMFEVMVTLIMLGVMATIVERTLATASKGEQHLQAIRRVTERSERVAYEVLHEVNRSRKLFQGDAVGDDYLDALVLPVPLLADTRLPVFDEINPLGPDMPGQPHTGNVLLFVVEAEAVPMVADAPTKKMRSIDLYRFICVYPTQTDRVVVVDSQMQPARDLVMWRSVIFPSRAQILAIEDDDERASVVTDLVDSYECTHAWNSNAGVDTAFYELDGFGGMADSPSLGMQIDEDPDRTEGGRLVYAGVQLARSLQGDPYRRSLFTSDDPADWVPDGFEIKVVGVSGSRKLWFRVCMESPASKEVVGVQSCTLTASPRDM